MLAATLKPLAEAQAWFVAPAGSLRPAPSGDLGLLDFWLRDPIAKAVAKGFWHGAIGESMWVAATGSPFSGILMLGYGNRVRDWADACELSLKALPATAPATATTVAVLPPCGVPAPKRAWAQAADRFVPVVKARWPQVRQWVWLSFDERNDV